LILKFRLIYYKISANLFGIQLIKYIWNSAIDVKVKLIDSGWIKALVLKKNIYELKMSIQTKEDEIKSDDGVVYIKMNHLTAVN